jgi:Tfp pilus assembly protein PilF
MAESSQFPPAQPRITAQPPSAESGRDIADEDFLFHLYRGSELLQDDRVHEAKEELEHALTFQPRDAKGQDLLGVVYFRLGLYPRAIQIYETLRNQNPREASLRLNLGLCYLKTAQANRAKDELEALVKAHPDHKRAWGYLGLAY